MLVVCGPTAAGKSRLALELALRAPSTIISADSRQVYRGFDIGTAKPSADERALVAHEGVDVADPRTRYSAAAWALAADGWIAAAVRAGGLHLIRRGWFIDARERATLWEEEKHRAHVIAVARDAQKTDAGQSFKGLLLSRGASANTKPELEIFADDVKCAHGAAIGQMDETAAFYMAARGLPPETARKLLVRAFVADAFAAHGEPDALLEAALGVLEDAG